MRSLFTKLQILLCFSVSSTIINADDAPGAGSANLSYVFKLAVDNDFQWAAKVHTYQANKESKKIGASGIKPVINATAQASQDAFKSDTFGNDDYNSRSYGLTLVQPLFRLDRWHDYQKGKALKNQAEANFHFEKQAFYVRITSVYFEVLRAKENLQFRNSEKSAIKSQMRQIQYRFKAGLAADTDVQEAKAAFDLVTVQQLIAQQEMDLALEELQTVTGISLNKVAPLKAVTPILPPSPESITDWTDIALKHNPLLSASSHAMQAAQRDSQAKSSGHLPTLDLVGNYNDTDRYIQTSEGELSASSISLKLEVPIYSGGGVSASRRQAKALYYQAREEYNFEKRQLIQNSRNLYRLVNTDISRVHAQAQGIHSMKAALTAIEAGYNNGTRTILDVLNAQNTLYAAKRDYANARFDYILDSLKLKQVAGILKEEDILNVNNWLCASEDRKPAAVTEPGCNF